MTSQSPVLLLVQTTLGSQDEARALADDLVELHWAACAQIGPVVESIYPWQGKIEHQSEVLLSLKTPPSPLAGLKARLRDKHPYDVPELIVLPVIETCSDYCEWVQDWVQNATPPKQL